MSLLVREATPDPEALFVLEGSPEAFNLDFTAFTDRTGLVLSDLSVLGVLFSAVEERSEEDFRLHPKASGDWGFSLANLGLLSKLFGSKSGSSAALVTFHVRYSLPKLF